MPATTDTICVPFSEWAIQAFLDGRKTQFRAPVDPQPHDDVKAIMQDGSEWFADKMCSEWDPPLWEQECPYPPGTLIAVQEAFRLPRVDYHYSPKEYVQDRDNAGLSYNVRYEVDKTTSRDHPRSDDNDYWGRLRPAEEMPEALCRIRLRVEDVGVERACEISEADAKAEGVQVPSRPSNAGYKTGFYHKWTARYGEDAWEKWCWRVYVAPEID